ncbi:hypothetical protein K435DRAFT_654428, partial [Dendrothele bispora CBS 962.96]
MCVNVLVNKDTLRNCFLETDRWWQRQLERALFKTDWSEWPRLDYEIGVGIKNKRPDTSDQAGLWLGTAIIESPAYASLQRNAGVTKDLSRSVPKPVVVVINIIGKPVRALLDTGSLGDFMSSSLADQLGVKRITLQKPIQLHLAVQGSRSKINTGTVAKLEYQGITEERYFDIINLSNYDVILGTPFLFQHRVSIGLNPIRVNVDSIPALPIRGDNVKELSSRAADLAEDSIELLRKELMDYARPLFQDASLTPLPPLRAINHEILLINPEQVIPWRPSRCPEALRAQWDVKRNAYISTGHWKVTNARNTCPVLCIPKPG